MILYCLVYQQSYKSSQSYHKNCVIFSPFFSAFSHAIYYNLGIIPTIHMWVRFWELLPVPSNASQNHRLVAVRLLDHCLGIISTLMRLESWLGGIQYGGSSFLKIFIALLLSYPSSNVQLLVVM